MEFDFEITATYCSEFSKSQHNKVLGSKKGEPSQSLLFEYDPIYSVDLPTITLPEKNRLVITVPAVSSIVARRHEWLGMRIEYDIGEINYQNGERRLDEKK
jgi:hypothetical protein